MEENSLGHLFIHSFRYICMSSIYISIHPSSIHLCIHPSTYLPVYLLICMCGSQTFLVSVPFCALKNNWWPKELWFIWLLFTDITHFRNWSRKIKTTMHIPLAIKAKMSSHIIETSLCSHEKIKENFAILSWENKIFDLADQLKGPEDPPGVHRPPTGNCQSVCFSFLLFFLEPTPVRLSP